MLYIDVVGRVILSSMLPWGFRGTCCLIKYCVGKIQYVTLVHHLLALSHQSVCVDTTTSSFTEEQESFVLPVNVKTGLKTVFSNIYIKRSSICIFYKKKSNTV